MNPTSKHSFINYYHLLVFIIEYHQHIHLYYSSIYLIINHFHLNLNQSIFNIHYDSNLIINSNYDSIVHSNPNSNPNSNPTIHSICNFQVDSLDSYSSDSSI